MWLTQARPITTLYPLPVNAQAPEIRPGEEPSDLRVYFCFSVAQGLYRPLTPMGLAAIRLLATSAELMRIRVTNPLAGPPAYAEAGQRIFVDATGPLHSRAGRALLPRMLDYMEARTAAIVRPMLSDPRVPMTRSSLWPFARRVLRIAGRFGVPFQVLTAVFRPSASCARIRQIGTQLRQRLAPPESASVRERLDFVERVLRTEAITLLPKTMPAAITGGGMLFIAGKLLGSTVTALTPAQPSWRIA
ncbi:MAG TPA: hypothetical protein VKU19_19640 [Bryobacteraceae bacterium]|nr:hypothetical protein [Bryobacteraceae bacterium]